MKMLVVIISLCTVSISSPYEVFVSPDGNDSFQGTEQYPWKSISKAIDSASAHTFDDGSIITLLNGYYNHFRLNLSAIHSGIIIRGKDKVVATGSIELDTTHSSPCDSNDVSFGIREELVPFIKKWSFDDLKITDTSFFSKAFFKRGLIPFMYCGDSLLSLSRYPDTGWWTIDSIVDEKIDTVNGKVDKASKKCIFITKKDIVNELSKNYENVFMGGYWRYDWFHRIETIKEIDVHNKTIYADTPYSASEYGYSKRARYAVYNLLSGINCPGKWAVNRKNKTLYYWPSSVLNNTFLCIKQSQPVNMSHCHDIKIENICFDGSFSNTFIYASECTSIVLNNCTVRNCSGNGVVAYKCLNCRIINNTIKNVGLSGVIITSGDRINLIPSNNIIGNNIIDNVSINIRTHQFPISLTHSSIGNRVINNTVRYSPHLGITCYGTGNVIERNLIENVCYETFDAGAIYCTYSFATQGTIINDNLIRNSGTEYFYGIYLDDLSSGLTVINNVVINNKNSERVTGITIGGGFNNKCIGNVVINESAPRSRWMNADNRGHGFRAPLLVSGGPIQRQLEGLKYKSEPWLSTYPDLATIFDEDPGMPKWNIIKDNVIVGINNETISREVVEYGIVDNNKTTDSLPWPIDFHMYGVQSSLNIDSIPPIKINKIIKKPKPIIEKSLLIKWPSTYIIKGCGFGSRGKLRQLNGYEIENIPEWADTLIVFNENNLPKGYNSIELVNNFYKKDTLFHYQW